MDYQSNENLGTPFLSVLLEMKNEPEDLPDPKIINIDGALIKLEPKNEKIVSPDIPKNMLVTYKVEDPAVYTCKQISLNQPEPQIKIENNEDMDESGQMYDNNFEDPVLTSEFIVTKEDLESDEASLSSKRCENEVSTATCNQEIQIYNFKMQPSQHNIKPVKYKFKCDKCTYETNRKHNLYVHLLNHKNPDEVNMFDCHHCDYQAKTKSYLKRHIRVHTNQKDCKMYKCGQCEYHSNHKFMIRRHYLKHKNPEEINMFKCDQCEFETRWKRSLQLHVLVHMNRENVYIFKCDQCGFQAARKYILKRHTLVHQKQENCKMYKCNQCDYQGARKDILKRHSHVHTKLEKRVKCINVINAKIS